MSADRLPPERLPPGRLPPRHGPSDRDRRPDPRHAAGPGRPPPARRYAEDRHAGGPRPAAEGWDAEGWSRPASPARPDRQGGPDRQDGPGRGGHGPGRARLPLWDRALRGLAGVLAGGLVVLSLGMVAVWLLADRWGVPGPGGFTVFWHLLGAVVAVGGQRIADRRPDRAGTLAAVVVTGAAALVLGLAWFF